MSGEKWCQIRGEEGAEFGLGPEHFVEIAEAKATGSFKPWLEKAMDRSGITRRIGQTCVID